MTQSVLLKHALRNSRTSIKTIQAPQLDKEKRQISHIVELPSGARVEFSAGGCAHYSFSYIFSRLKQMPNGGDKGLFEFIRQQLRSVPLKDGQLEFLQRMIDALELASAKSDNWQSPSNLYSPFGDASAYLSLANDGFAITYDFPL